MKKKQTVLKVIIIILSVFQCFSYLGSLNSESIKETGTYAFAYYLGFNLPIIIACILLIIYLIRRRNFKKDEAQNLIDSIGKE